MKSVSTDYIHTASISQAIVDWTLFQNECRRTFSGDKSLIQGRRTAGDIQAKAETAQARKS
jgi:hypothetical protein